MEWYWLPEYAPRFLEGLWLTLQLLGLSIFFGMSLAIPIGLAQVTGPWPLAWTARAFCTVIRGTPLLIQLWLIYYGLGSLFPFIPGIRESMIWPLLREAFPYAVVAFSLSVAGYEGEVMRGAFRSVPRGELEAARAMGMSPFKVLRRIWLPRALQNVFPTLAGEFILTLKATPLAATITVFEVYGVGSIVRQETYRIYEPLLFVALIYLCLTFVLVIAFRLMERRMPQRSA
ncbi:MULTISPECIES: ABC transporter permease [Tritonibacter]|uniref:ABC transporter permease subunit n=1 Tax=Tritonibacter scottomollicae TaxID=483013 RepID=A0A2T1AP91_TRISK|nr:ABC transporter permease subunit [Tritonibacter scottomollicae]PRZ50419.1 amino acid ABC transporter membrane protein 2 (PAAT family) [Tritonibacter scottomollicae]WOI35175.1 ABC transporter permease subunit [Tritonibacter scottomollicae]